MSCEVSIVPQETEIDVVRVAARALGGGVGSAATAVAISGEADGASSPRK